MESNIVFVECHTTNKNTVIADIALIFGVSVANVKVKKWYDDYSAFVYDKEHGNLIFYKSRYMGAWEEDRSIYNYKK